MEIVTTKEEQVILSEKDQIKIYAYPKKVALMVSDEKCVSLVYLTRSECIELIRKLTQVAGQLPNE